MSETEGKYTTSDKYVNSFRLRLRGSSRKLDEEITDLINAARDDLVLGGVLSVKVQDENDPLIKQALVTYLKAEFGLDNPDAEEYRAAYESLKKRLMNSEKYTREEA